MANYNRALLYVFSGTGNTYRVAQWIEERAMALGISAAVTSLDHKCSIEEKFVAGDLIGFLAPTHGFTAPWGTIRIAWRMPPGNGADALVVATQGASFIGKWMIPGLQGTCGYLLALILALKGYRIRCVEGVDMPANWIAFHWGISRPNVELIEQCSRARLERWIDRVLNGKPVFGAIIPLMLGLCLAQVSLMYLICARFIFAKTLFYSPRCSGCGECVKSCPFGAIRMTAGKPFWTFNCESCMRCMNYCPLRAIEGAQLLIILIVILSTFPLGDMAVKLLPDGIAWLNAGAGRVLFQWIVVMALITAMYGIFMLLNRITIFNEIFSRLTLTRYWRRYHEPGVPLKKLCRQDGLA